MKFAIKFGDMVSADGPLPKVIGTVAEAFGHKIVDQEDCDMILVDNTRGTLDLLKENEDVKIGIVMLPRGASIEGARSLKRNFPGRIEILHAIPSADMADEPMLVPFFLEIAGKEGLQ